LQATFTELKESISSVRVWLFQESAACLIVTLAVNDYQRLVTDGSVAKIGSVSSWIETQHTTRVLDTVKTTVQTVGIKFKESCSSEWIGLLFLGTALLILTLGRDWWGTERSVSNVGSSSVVGKAELASGVTDTVKTTIQTVKIELEISISSDLVGTLQSQTTCLIQTLGLGSVLKSRT